MPPRRIITGRSQEPRQRFAEELRALRAQSGDSLRQLGERLGWDWSLFGKMESGETLGGPEVVEALDQHYGTPGLLLTLWELAVGDPSQFREQYRRYMPLEAEAKGIQMYSPSVIPGLLQTQEYARAVLHLGGLTPEGDLDQQVEARMNRREVPAREGAPQFRVILDETVLRRALPDVHAWRVQLEHLSEAAESPNVQLQVLPFSAGLREMSNTDTSFLRLLDGRTVAWIETGYSGELVEETAAVDQRQFSYARLRDHALRPRRTAEFITHLLEEVPCPPRDTT